MCGGSRRCISVVGMKKWNNADINLIAYFPFAEMGKAHENICLYFCQYDPLFWNKSLATISEGNFLFYIRITVLYSSH